MPESTNSTHWTVIVDAAAGDRTQADKFGRQYRPVVVAYLGARWRRSHLQQETDDATQEVFVDLFKEGGALQRVDSERAGGFRAYLFGIVRNVALRFEERAARRTPGIPSELDIAADDDALSTIYDRAWARVMLTRAAEVQAAHAQNKSEPAQRRVELLRLRFQEGLRTREIAERWGVEAKHVQRQYDKARDEFRLALLEVVAFHYPGEPAEAEREAARLVNFFS